MKFTIFMMRHGETYLNKYKRMQGWSDSPLTQEAIAQIKNNRNSYVSLKPDIVITSDLHRTIETANLIFHKETKLHKIPAFREIHFGGLECADHHKVWDTVIKNSPHSSLEELREAYTMKELSDMLYKIDPDKTAETGLEVEKRIEKTFEILKSLTNENDKVFIVTHGAFMRHFIYHFSNIQLGQINNLTCVKLEVDTSKTRPIVNVTLE